MKLPAYITQRLEDARGKNPHGEPMLKLVWGQQCVCNWPRVRFFTGEVQLHEINCPAINDTPAWILQGWKPVDCTEYEWDHAGDGRYEYSPEFDRYIDIRGPYPGRGVYHNITILMNERGDPVTEVTESIVNTLLEQLRTVEETSQYDRVKEKTKQIEERTFEPVKDQIDEMLDDVEFFERRLNQQGDPLSENYFGKKMEKTIFLPDKKEKV